MVLASLWVYGILRVTGSFPARKPTSSPHHPWDWYVSVAGRRGGLSRGEVTRLCLRQLQFHGDPQEGRGALADQGATRVKAQNFSRRSLTRGSVASRATPAHCSGIWHRSRRHEPQALCLQTRLPWDLRTSPERYGEQRQHKTWNVAPGARDG